MYKMHDKNYYVIYPPQSKKTLNQLLVEHNQMAVLEKSTKYYHEYVLHSENEALDSVISLLRNDKDLSGSRFIELKNTYLDDAGFVKTK